jgi:hypothetical protein
MTTAADRLTRARLITMVSQGRRPTRGSGSRYSCGVSFSTPAVCWGPPPIAAVYSSKKPTRCSAIITQWRDAADAFRTLFGVWGRVDLTWHASGKTP